MHRPLQWLSQGHKVNRDHKARKENPELTELTGLKGRKVQRAQQVVTVLMVLMALLALRENLVPKDQKDRKDRSESESRARRVTKATRETRETKGILALKVQQERMQWITAKISIRSNRGWGLMLTYRLKPWEPPASQRPTALTQIANLSGYR
jgi:hypothetical protein